MENWTSADIMTFFCSSLDFVLCGKLDISEFFSKYLCHFFQQIAIIFFNFFVDSWLDSPHDVTIATVYNNGRQYT